MKKISKFLLGVTLVSSIILPVFAKERIIELKTVNALEEIYNSDEFKTIYFRLYPQRTELDLRLHYLSRRWDVSFSLAHAIISCESGHDVSAISKTDDWGLWQINHVWDEELRKLGLDRKNENENIIAGFYILKNYGTWPWNPSRSCWSKLIAKK